MSIVHEDLEPGVIDTAMIMKALEEERPAGEAGKLAAQEGIVLKDITSLRLQFLNILKIDHLWMMTSLVKLQLGNNIIEKIEGLNSLVNLKELDLSFNNIEVIENLEVLVKLEILTLFSNRIRKLEKMESLVNLTIFSIGNNKIENRKDVIYLRQFPLLRSLNMSGNPCVKNEDKDFRKYICACLPNLTYYGYCYITSEERSSAKETYSGILKQLEESEEKQRKIKEAAEARAKELEFHTEAFVEDLDEDQLFLAMFEDDVDGKALLKMSAATDIYNNFHNETLLVIQDLFKTGLEQHNIRQQEIQQFYKCVDTAKEESRVSSQQYLEPFLEKKNDIFSEIQKILQTVQELADKDENADTTDYFRKMQDYADQFSKECEAAWYTLMEQELTLFEQMEEVNANFERNMNDLVASFVESVQSHFVQIRNLEANYGEEISEVANAYLTNLNITNIVVPPELKQIMTDKESLNGATTQSHDTHLLVIDAREDKLITRVRTWVENYCEEVHKEEIKRSRKKVIEINHFLDIQREEFEDFNIFPLDIIASPPASGLLADTFIKEVEETLAELGVADTVSVESNVVDEDVSSAAGEVEADEEEVTGETEDKDDESTYEEKETDDKTSEM